MKEYSVALGCFVCHRFSNVSIVLLGILAHITLFFVGFFMLERWNWFSRTAYSVPNIEVKFIVWTHFFFRFTFFSEWYNYSVNWYGAFSEWTVLTKVWQYVYEVSPLFHIWQLCMKFHKINLSTHDISPPLFILHDTEYSFGSFKGNKCCFIFIGIDTTFYIRKDSIEWIFPLDIILELKIISKKWENMLFSSMS